MAEPIVIETGKVIDAGPAERPSPEVVMGDRQRLIGLRPPTDPVTGMMVFDTPQAAEYREALRDIVERYGSIESFQEAMRDSGTGQGPRLASAAAPDVPGSYSLANGPSPPNPVAGLPAASSLAAFAQKMMAPGSDPAAAGVVQNAGPTALMPRRSTGTVL